MLDQIAVRNRLVVLSALLIVLVACAILYGSRHNSFAPTQPVSSAGSTFTNPEILQNWLPAESYAYTVARINDYLRTNDMPVASLSVKGTVTFTAPTYDFTVDLTPQGQTLNVVVTVTNDSGVLGTTVAIDGQQQNPIVPTSQNSLIGSTNYTGFDALINAGVTAVQADELQQALLTFAPTARSIAVDPNSVQLETAASDGASQPYTFTLSIDDKTYNATLNALGLLRIQLSLSDPAQGNRPVLNSGIISQGS